MANEDQDPQTPAVAADFTQHAEVTQEDLLQLAEEFQRDHPDMPMQYDGSLASTVKGTVPVVFAFLGPSSEAVEARPTRPGTFWNAFKKANSEWLDTISICDDVVRDIHRTSGNENPMKSLDDVYLLDLYPWALWSANVEPNYNDQLAREWFDRNMAIIRPIAVIVFTKRAAIEAGDVLMFTEEGSSISTSAVSPLRSIRHPGRDLDFKFNIVCHPGYLSRATNFEPYEEFVGAIMSTVEELRGDTHNVADYNATVNTVTNNLFEVHGRIVSLVAEWQDSLCRDDDANNGRRTIREIREYLRGAGVDRSEQTLRNALKPFIVDRVGTAFKYFVERPQHDDASN